MMDDTYILLSRLLGSAAGIIVLLAITIPWIVQRIKKRRRCPKCWYDLSHTQGLQCSECGHTAKRERRLYRSKRARKSVAFALLLAIGGYAAMVTPAVRDHGWSRAVPTTALIITYPILRPPLSELQSRPRPAAGTTGWWTYLSAPLYHDLVWERSPEIDPASWRGRLLTFIGRRIEPAFFLHHDPFPTVRDQIFATTTFEGGTRLQWNRSTSAENVPPTFITRPRWPVGAQVWAEVAVDVPEAISAEMSLRAARMMTPWYAHHRYTAKPLSPGGEPWTRGSHDPVMLAIGTAAAGTDGMTFCIEGQTLLTSEPIGALRWVDDEPIEAAAKFEVVDSMDEAITPVRVAELDRIIAHPEDFYWGQARGRFSTAPGLTLAGPRYDILTVDYWFRSPDDWVGDGEELALSMRADLRIEDTVVADLDLQSTRHESGWQTIKWTVRPRLDNDGDAAVIGPGQWLVLRITADPHAALRDFNATHYWDGTVEIDLPYRNRR